MNELEQQLTALRDAGATREEAEKMLWLITVKAAGYPSLKYRGVGGLVFRMSLKVLDKVYANENHHCGG